MSEDRSPAETMIHCLELFGESEPTCVVALWLDVDGNINWSHSKPYSLSTIYGMLACMQEGIRTDWRGDNDGAG